MFLHMSLLGSSEQNYQKHAEEKMACNKPGVASLMCVYLIHTLPTRQGNCNWLSAGGEFSLLKQLLEASALWTETKCPWTASSKRSQGYSNLFNITIQCVLS